jgi:hypothetical protein
MNTRQGIYRILNRRVLHACSVWKHVSTLGTSTGFIRGHNGTIVGEFGLLRKSFDVRLPPTSCAIIVFYCACQPIEQSGCRFASTMSDIKASTKNRILKANISTLHPRLLQETDYLDISSQSMISLRGSRKKNRPGYLPIEMRYYPRDPQPFPPGSHGFLYYITPPGLPPTAGEIRFRITPTNSPASFHLGTDLLSPYGMPWRIQIFSRANSLSWESLCNFLLRDRQITHPVLSEMMATIGPSSRSILPNCLFSLEQPFPYEFSTTGYIVWAAANGELTKAATEGLLTESDTGLVLITFNIYVVSNLPPGRRISRSFLKVLKTSVISPV